MKNLASIYLRLSRDDGEEMESNSISNQRSLITAYCKANGITIVNEYVDDGVSGATFERPSFQRMISDLKAKKFNTIIVKDLSRFGRDYIESGKYIQKVFPELGVRFISINDNYDSALADANDTHLILPIRNFINDSYCRDISMKVKSSQKMKRMNGEFIGAFAPFGYMKSKKDRHQLVVDPKVRHIIEKIFAMKLEGYSSSAIAKYLNEIGAITPAKHREMTGADCCGFIGTKNSWDAKMVNRVITNRVYIGTLEQGKAAKLNYKSKKRVQLDMDEWVVIDNAHEPIVSKMQYQIANEMLLRDLSSKGKPGILSGLLFCKDCGAQMVKRTVRYKDTVNTFYICGSHNANGGCSRHSIKEEKLIKTLEILIHDYLELNKEIDETLREINIEDLHYEVEFDYLQAEKKKYETLRQSLFMDLEDDLITEDEFARFRANYAAKIHELDRQIQKKTELVQEIKESLLAKEPLLPDGIYESDGKLNRYMLVHLIKQINIHEDDEIDVVFYDEKLSMIQRAIKAYKRRHLKLVSFPSIKFSMGVAANE